MNTPTDVATYISRSVNSAQGSDYLVARDLDKSGIDGTPSSLSKLQPLNSPDNRSLGFAQNINLGLDGPHPFPGK